MTQINTFKELINFIEKTELSPEQLQHILSQSIRVYRSDYTDKTQIVKELKEYWKKYSHIQDRPLFLDKVDCDVKINDFEGILYCFKS